MNNNLLIIGGIIVLILIIIPHRIQKQLKKPSTTTYEVFQGIKAIICTIGLSLIIVGGYNIIEQTYNQQAQANNKSIHETKQQMHNAQIKKDHLQTQLAITENKLQGYISANQQNKIDSTTIKVQNLKQQIDTLNTTIKKQRQNLE